MLIDPDKAEGDNFDNLLIASISCQIDYFLIGGSLISSDRLSYVLNKTARIKNIPKILFPGNSLHIDNKADGILFLSLISGRNPEYLIGQQVISAPILKNSGLEILSTGYMLIDGGVSTTVSYISNTTPIPNSKNDIAVATALAGEMLGNKLIYLDCGSGAKYTVPAKMIEAVRKNINLPLIVGGGIRTAEQASSAWNAGADIVVVGNALEENPGFLYDLNEIRKKKRIIA